MYENTVQVTEKSVGAGSYDGWFAELTNSDADVESHLTRVHTETCLSEEWDYSNDKQSDIVVLDYPAYRPVQLFKGRRRIDESAIGAAIELKYLTGNTSFPPLKGNVDLRSADIDSLTNDIRLDSSDIEKDLDSLKNGC